MDTVPPPPPPPPPNSPFLTPVASSGEDKTVAIVSYLTLIGFIVAVILHGNKKTQLGTYHLRQSLGLMIAGVAVWICMMVLVVIPFLGWLLGMCLWIALIIVWFFGVIAAANGQMKPVPVLGKHFEKWFSSAFE